MAHIQTAGNFLNYSSGEEDSYLLLYIAFKDFYSFGVFSHSTSIK